MPTQSARECTVAASEEFAEARELPLTTPFVAFLIARRSERPPLPARAWGLPGYVSVDSIAPYQLGVFQSRERRVKRSSAASPQPEYAKCV